MVYYSLNVNDKYYDSIDKARKGAVAYMRRHKAEYMDAGMDRSVTVYIQQPYSPSFVAGYVAFDYAGTPIWCVAGSHAYAHVVNKDGSIRKR